ncbi:MAG: metallophosphoesterase family protein, partial [Dethiobacteraceae bacterium]
MNSKKKFAPNNRQRREPFIFFGGVTMRIGVISDTHIPARSRQLPPELFTLFAGVELILHAGDVAEEYVLNELAAIAPVEAVAG